MAECGEGSEVVIFGTCSFDEFLNGFLLGEYLQKEWNHRLFLFEFEKNGRKHERGETTAFLPHLAAFQLLLSGNVVVVDGTDWTASLQGLGVHSRRGVKSGNNGGGAYEVNNLWGIHISQFRREKINEK